MKLLYVDFETTSADPKTTRVVEYCFRLHDRNDGSDVSRSGFLWSEDYKLEAGAVAVHGRDADFLRAKGTNPADLWKEVAGSIGRVDLLVAHNARSFDKVVMEAELARFGYEVPHLRWLDTRYDLPFPEKMNCRKLSHLCFDHDIVVDKEQTHGAAYDVAIMKQLVEKYDLKDVLAILTSPLCIIRAHVNFEEKDLAKAQGFKWQTIDGMTFPKTWIKQIRKAQLQTEIDKAEFHITILKEIPYA